jgi:hypothetical protein
VLVPPCVLVRLDDTGQEWLLYVEESRRGQPGGHDGSNDYGNVHLG